MIVEKVLNNNVVVSIDPNTRKEVILMGSGIAFNKKPGQLIDDKKIEKTFIKMPYVIILFKIKISILPLCNYLNKINKCWTTIPNSAIITSIGGDT